MNNRHRTAEVIRTWQKRHKNIMDSDPEWAAQNLAIDLHNAGLITPDLPEPDEEGRFIVGQRAIWVDSSGVLCMELRGLDGYVATYGTTIPIGEAAEARYLAAAILAAATHQEKA